MNDCLLSNKTNRHFYFKVITSLFLSILSFSAHSDTPQKFDFYLPTQSTNKSLLAQLTSALNTVGLSHINVRRPKQWQTYQQSVRHGRDGIYLSPPHFSAWLQHQHGFKPILKLNGTLSYVIVSDTSRTDIFEIRDLINKKICSRSPLNLDYLLITDAFAKNVQSAEVHIVNSVIDELHNPESLCAAFSITEHQFYELETAQQGEYIRLIQGSRYSNYAVLASPSVDDETLSQLKKFLRLASTQSILKPLLGSLSSGQTLIDVQNSDYSEQDAEDLLKYWPR